jgi:signal transduction histidine kinase
VVFVLAVPQALGEGTTPLVKLPLDLAQLAFPLCVAVAVLRHRLVAIDVIVNRPSSSPSPPDWWRSDMCSSSSWSASSSAVAQGGFWPSLFATALVAMAFQPLRRRVVGLADRLAFGDAAAPYVALADFSRRLGDSSDPAALLPAMAEAAAHAVNASRATVVLHVAAGPDVVAVWAAGQRRGPGGHRRRAARRRPWVSGSAASRWRCRWAPGAPAGPASAGRPRRAGRPGVPQRAADRGAVRSGGTARPAHRQACRVPPAPHHRRDAERSRIEEAIARQVLQHLRPIPDRLRSLSRMEPDASRPLDPAELVPLVESLNAALESLREITVGVFPAQLARSGLEAALGSLLARPAAPVAWSCVSRLSDSGSNRRSRQRPTSASPKLRVTSPSPSSWS